MKPGRGRRGRAAPTLPRASSPRLGRGDRAPTAGRCRHRVAPCRPSRGRRRRTPGRPILPQSVTTPEITSGDPIPRRVLLPTVGFIGVPSPSSGHTRARCSRPGHARGRGGRALAVRGGSRLAGAVTLPMPVTLKYLSKGPLRLCTTNFLYYRHYLLYGSTGLPSRYRFCRMS